MITVRLIDILFNRFIKNRYWRKKNRPRNAAIHSANVKKALQKPNTTASDESEEAEDELVLTQPIPKEGWFPESDSSSSDFEIATPNHVSTSTSSNKNYIDDNKECDKDWFDKELDVSHCFNLMRF